MVMENEGLASTDWTSTVPHPFGPAPGGGTGGLASTRWTSTVPTPFGPAPGGGRMGGMYESGFAAERVGQGIDPDYLIRVQQDLVVTRKDTPGVPSMVVSMRYTDSGTLTKEILDKHIQAMLSKSDLRVSTKTLWQRTPVTWRWKMDGAIYYPIIASGPLEGTRYSGNAIELPVLNPTDVLLAKLPSAINIYTIAITSKNYDLTDGDAARALTLIKQASRDMARYDAYKTMAVVVRGVETSVFAGKVQPKPVDPTVDPTPTTGPNTGVAVGLGLRALLALYAATRGEAPEGAVL